MKTKLLTLLFIFTFTIAGLPNFTQAYTSGTKEAEKITPFHNLYSVEFRWDFGDKDLLIPVSAYRSIPNNSPKNALGFELLSEHNLRVKTGTTTAFVIADLPIENGYYHLKAGDTATFKLLALHETASSTQKLKLQVTALPFMFINKTNTIHTYLHPQELKGYQTEAI